MLACQLVRSLLKRRIPTRASCSSQRFLGSIITLNDQSTTSWRLIIRDMAAQLYPTLAKCPAMWSSGNGFGSLIEHPQPVSAADVRDGTVQFASLRNMILAEETTNVEVWKSLRCEKWDDSHFFGGVTCWPSKSRTRKSELQVIGRPPLFFEDTYFFEVTRGIQRVYPPHIVDEHFIQQANLGGSNSVIHGIFVDIYCIDWLEGKWNYLPRKANALILFWDWGRVVIPIVKELSPPSVKLLMAGIRYRIDTESVTNPFYKRDWNIPGD